MSRHNELTARAEDLETRIAVAQAVIDKCLRIIETARVPATTGAWVATGEAVYRQLTALRRGVLR